MDDTRYDISFCIPTYNFGSFIGETLDNIIAQADDRIQIVIIDGGSTDNTAEVVAEKTRAFPHIKFFRRQQRCGVDRDILESVAQADGSYCWLFSADDLLAPGAVAALREAFREPWDVTLTAFTQCDLNMKPLIRNPVMATQSTEFMDWRTPSGRRRHAQLACGSSAYFSFISIVIVRRRFWMLVPPQERFIGSCWIIAAQLYAASRHGMVVRFDPRQLVLRRGDNDSFMSMGIVRRWALAINGFREVAEHYFGAGSVEARGVSRSLRQEMSVPDMIICKLRVADAGAPEDLTLFNQLARRHYGDPDVRSLFWRHFIADLSPSQLSLLRRIFCFLRDRVLRKVLR